MNITIKLTDTAKQDLREIGHYIAEKACDKEPAIRFIKELQESCKTLADFPNSGAVPKDHILKSNGYRYLIHKDYLIFYQYVAPENMIYILAFFNSKKDYFREMRRFL